MTSDLWRCCGVVVVETDGFHVVTDPKFYPD